jgi:hypothetical protein
MSRFDQPQSGGPEPSASGISHRVQSILQAAEEAARDIRYEAEMEKRRMTRESDRRVAEVDDGLRRMAAVADALVERADELRRQVDEMIGTLRQTVPDNDYREPAPRHDDRPARPRFTGAAPRARVERRQPEPVVEPEPEPEPGPEPVAYEPEPIAYEPEQVNVPDPAPEPVARDLREGEMGPERLVALQMAMAGRSREEAAERLVRGFGLDDPSPILDEVFG